MILTCPECRTRYQIDAANLPPAGRKVRCAKCGHLWHQAAPQRELEPAPGHEVSGAVMAVASSAAPARFERATINFTSAGRARRPWAERLGLVAGWSGFLAILLVAGWTGIRFRQEIVALWPQSSSLYELLGIAANANGIAIVDPAFRREVEDGQPVLAVTGRLINTTSHELGVPTIRVALIDRDERELCHWTFSPAQSTLQPGQSLKFFTRLSSPPAGARHLEMRFAANRE